MYREGQGAVQGIEEAVRWFRLAAEQGNENAIAALKELAAK